MQLASLSFVFLFLPVSIAVYYSLPDRYKNLCLLAISLAFYAFLSWQGMVLMAAMTAVDYAVAAGIHRLGPQHPRARQLCSALAAATVALIAGTSAYAQIEHFDLPLGFYVYLLTGLGYVVDLYRGEAEFEPNPARFGVMCCFFGKLYAGPLVEYSEVAADLRSPVKSLTGVGEGVLMFVRGLAKKVLLADQISVVFTTLGALPSGQLPVLGAWMMVLSSAFATYFNLSSYCDMAVGLGQVFGLSLPANFSYPFQSRTVTDFFARFNITVTRYIRRYVYRVLGYDTGGRLSNALNLMLTAMLAGLWFGLRLNTLVWGMFLGGFMVIEALWAHRWLENIPPFFLRIYAFAVVLLSYAIFAGSSLTQSWNTFVVMMGFSGHGFTNDTVQYMLLTRGSVMVACMLFSTSLFARLGQWLRQRSPLLLQVLTVASNAALLLLAVSMMI